MTTTPRPGVRGVLTLLTALLLAGCAGSHDTPGKPENAAATTPIGPTPAPTPTPRSQSPQTWIDTPLIPHDGYGWDVPDPLEAARSAWFAVAADHLDPTGQHFEPQGEEGSMFTWQTDGSLYSVQGRTGVVVDRDQLNPFDGCRYLLEGTAPSNGTESCRDERLGGPDGERAKISRYQRLCGSWDPGRAGDTARPGPGSTYATCGDFRVAVAVKRRDGRIGYLVVNGRGTPDDNPFTPEAMAAVAADPLLTLPNDVSGVPSNQAAASVVSDHFPDWLDQPGTSGPADQPGYANVGGRLGRNLLIMSLWPAGGSPRCGRSWLVHCVERRVYGTDDPTTVFVGAWDEQDWADCCPRNSRVFTRQFVHVGPRHTVVVGVTRILRRHEDGIGGELDQRVIDLLLDPRLQQVRHH